MNSTKNIFDKYGVNFPFQVLNENETNHFRSFCYKLYKELDSSTLPAQVSVPTDFNPFNP